MQTVKLKKGHTLADVTETIEAEVVKYMAGKRRLGEQAFRALLDKDAEVRASYARKISRALKSTGLNLSTQVGK